MIESRAGSMAESRTGSMIESRAESMAESRTGVSLLGRQGGAGEVSVEPPPDSILLLMKGFGVRAEPVRG